MCMESRGRVKGGLRKNNIPLEDTAKTSRVLPSAITNRGRGGGIAPKQIRNKSGRVKKNKGASVAAARPCPKVASSFARGKGALGSKVEIERDED